MVLYKNYEFRGLGRNADPNGVGKLLTRTGNVGRQNTMRGLEMRSIQWSGNGGLEWKWWSGHYILPLWVTHFPIFARSPFLTSAHLCEHEGIHHTNTNET